MSTQQWVAEGQTELFKMSVISSTIAAEVKFKDEQRRKRKIEYLMKTYTVTRDEATTYYEKNDPRHKILNKGLVDKVIGNVAEGKLSRTSDKRMPAAPGGDVKPKIKEPGIGGKIKEAIKGPEPIEESDEEDKKKKEITKQRKLQSPDTKAELAIRGQIGNETKEMAAGTAIEKGANAENGNTRLTTVDPKNVKEFQKAGDCPPEDREYADDGKHPGHRGAAYKCPSEEGYNGPSSNKGDKTGFKKPEEDADPKTAYINRDLNKAEDITKSIIDSLSYSYSNMNL